MVQLSSAVIEGYLTRFSFDPRLAITSFTRPAELGEEKVGFVFDSELIQLKYPRRVLARAGSLRVLYVPIEMIDQIEPFSGRFEGPHGMGEPFWLPAWQAELMSEKPPVFSCIPPTERSELEWVSYNPEVGEKELAPLCAKAEPDPMIADSLFEKGNVFMVVYPAD